LTGDRGPDYLSLYLRHAMLTDREADEIERGRRAGVGGPLVLKWIDQLLADRRERVEHIEHLRRRLHQAFRYLDGLLRDVQRAAPRPAEPAYRSSPAEADASRAPSPPDRRQGRPGR
jgi:hypothetical protein